MMYVCASFLCPLVSTWIKNNGTEMDPTYQLSQSLVSAEPRILMESTEPLTLDLIMDYENAASGECIIQVPEVRSTCTYD